MWKNIKAIIININKQAVIAIIGIACVSVGVGLYSRPAGLIALGVLFLFDVYRKAEKGK